uniref:Uncharacterized protein n=1 Tax=Glossina brevipalpis TaxID=37001 RepID=A0A1A9WGV4_9MUSC
MHKIVMKPKLFYRDPLSIYVYYCAVLYPVVIEYFSSVSHFSVFYYNTLLYYSTRYYTLLYYSLPFYATLCYTLLYVTANTLWCYKIDFENNSDDGQYGFWDLMQIFLFDVSQNRLHCIRRSFGHSMWHRALTTAKSLMNISRQYKGKDKSALHRLKPIS